MTGATTMLRRMVWTLSTGFVQREPILPARATQTATKITRLSYELSPPSCHHMVSMNMAEILFPAYREYKDSRVQVNDAMSALLVGARVAAHTLTLTAGSTATLGQLFPTVDHIDRFNMRSDVARDFLNSADHHVASVAIPYALATHEDFTMSMISMLKEEGWDLRVGNTPIRAWNMHAVLFGVFHEQEPSSWIESFHVLREMRNCITHSGGRVDQKLREALQQMSAESRQGWSSINNGTEPENMGGPTGRLNLTAEHMFTAFAVTKRLGREINKLLANHLSRNTGLELQ